MWEKYSANHTGICVGFNPKTMFKYHRGGGGKVFYCSELPIIKPTPWESFEVQMIKQLYSKLDKWSFEEEYRADIFNYNPLTKEDRIVTLPPETYREIIFGAKISNENKKDIIAIAKQTMPHIVFKQANFTNNNGIELTPCTNL